MLRSTKRRAGKVKYALLGWLIGPPIPIIIILLFVRGYDLLSANTFDYFRTVAERCS